MHHSQSWMFVTILPIDISPFYLPFPSCALCSMMSPIALFSPLEHNCWARLTDFPLILKNLAFSLSPVHHVCITMYQPRARAPTMVCSFENKFHQLAVHCSVFTPDRTKWLKRSVGLPWSQQGRAAIIFCRWQHRLQHSMTNLTESSKSSKSISFWRVCNFAPYANFGKPLLQLCDKSHPIISNVF